MQSSSDPPETQTTVPVSLAVTRSCPPVAGLESEIKPVSVSKGCCALCQVLRAENPRQDHAFELISLEEAVSAQGKYQTASASVAVS